MQSIGDLGFVILWYYSAVLFGILLWSKCFLRDSARELKNIWSNWMVDQNIEERGLRVLY